MERCRRVPAHLPEPLLGPGGHGVPSMGHAGLLNQMAVDALGMPTYSIDASQRVTWAGKSV